MRLRKLMAWLFHPDDLESLKASIPRCPESGTLGRLRAGCGVEVRASSKVERGHIEDTDHPELGAPTFSEFGKRYVAVMERKEIHFNEAVAMFEKLAVGSAV